MIEKILILYFYLKAKYFTHFNSKKELESWHAKKMEKFIKRILPKSKFYASLYENGITLTDDKIINKKIMIENFDALNTAGISIQEALNVAQKAEAERDFSPNINGYSVGLSSGTSGNRGVFLVSAFERAFWCGTILGKMLPYNIFKKTKIAFFLRANNNLYETVRSSIFQFSFFDLKKDCTLNLQELNNFQPNILLAPPNMLKIICTAQENKEINLNPYRIVSVADVLHKDVQSRLEKVFNQPIHQIYQATEGFLGCTCEHGRLHLNEDIIHIRKKYLDEKRFVPIITDFCRTTQPVINYELNDILVEDATPCPCGSHFTSLYAIEGRCDDILRFKNNDGKETNIFPDFIVRCILNADSQIEYFKVVQNSASSVQFHIPENILQEKKENLLNSLADFFKEQDMNVSIEVKEYIPEKDLSLKQKRVQRCYD